MENLFVRVLFCAAAQLCVAFNRSSAIDEREREREMCCCRFVLVLDKHQIATMVTVLCVENGVGMAE